MHTGNVEALYATLGITYVLMFFFCWFFVHHNRLMLVACIFWPVCSLGIICFVVYCAVMGILTAIKNFVVDLYKVLVYGEA